ncbi:MAG: hypothetical protein IAG13_36185 [Deltaproteobacteria bacterium]|nr:hypothetical protein [Nannocystaceae bacterium]
MYTINNAVGALVEIRIWTPVTVEEAGAWSRDHDRVVDGVADTYVCFVDLVGATVFPPGAVEAYTAVMRDEPRLRRTGILLGTSAVQSLQVDRMLRDASNPVRRAYRDPLELLAWLDPVLGPLERVRLRSVMRQHGHVTELAHG